MSGKGDIERIGGRLYRSFYRYRELYESLFETVVGTLEIGLIGLGLVVSAQRVLTIGLAGSGMDAWEIAKQFAEFGVFILLSLLTLSRFFVAFRKKRLGYSYRLATRDLEEPDPERRRAFFDAIERVPTGHAPGLAAGWTEQIAYVADRIAHQTASLLSIRSWFLQDERWRAREQDSLDQWFSSFPAALWQVHPDGDGTSDYYSVTIPMTAQSARSIRRGQRATDMAEIDPLAVRAFSVTGSGPATPLRRVELLAYLHIHIPGANETRDDAALLAASFQHLAFLLFGLFGTGDAFERRWNFNVLCESSNREMNLVLHSMGFVPVVRERDGSETQEREARSYAGFLLFELVVEDGECKESLGRSLLTVLRRLVLKMAGGR